MLCDLDVWEKYKQYTWREHNGYAMTAVKHKNTYMHRLAIGDAPRGYVIDHINQNQLDNRRINLRKTTTTVNMINMRLRKNNHTGYVGISQDKHGCYVASITIKKKRIYLGYFKNLEDAIKARKRAEEKYHKPIIDKETLQQECFFNITSNHA